MNQGVILLGHGSRREEANAEVRAIEAMLRQKRPQTIYSSAYLSLQTPDLSEAVEQMAQRGVNRIIVMPLFLFTGDHVKKDIPNLVQKLGDTYPEVQIVLARHFGADPGIVDIVQQRIEEAQNTRL